MCGRSGNDGAFALSVARGFHKLEIVPPAGSLYLAAWFDERAKRGQFVEAASPSYQGDSVAALFNIRDFAEDEVLRKKADMYLDLVYATALRKVEDPGAAEEIAQNVFAALARKAWQFAPDDSLPAWLHKGGFAGIQTLAAR